MTPKGRRAGCVLLLTGFLIASSGCGIQGLSYRQDKRVTIVAPANHSTLQLPVEIRWKVHGFTITGPSDKSESDAGYFALFLDRAPQPPGKPIDYLARGDRRCDPAFGCPNARWFVDHHIYPTKATSFVIDALPTFTKEDRRRFHEVTIVLLDGRGNRIGESAYYVEFRVVGES